MNRTLLCAALGATLALATGAVAEDAQMHVRIGDLNLRAPAGASVALQRIVGGAKAFCQANDGPRSLDQTAQVDACVSRMSGQAVASLNAPLVTALFENRAPATSTTVLAAR